MILWLAVIGAGLVVAVACAWFFLRADRDRSPHDPDWGDWPSDQMAP